MSKCTKRMCPMQHGTVPPDCDIKDCRYRTEGTVVMWQYCTDPNEINDAIESNDPNWQGLTDASQIISISWDAHQICYIVFWRI